MGEEWSQKLIMVGGAQKKCSGSPYHISNNNSKIMLQKKIIECLTSVEFFFIEMYFSWLFTFSLDFVWLFTFSLDFAWLFTFSLDFAWFFTFSLDFICLPLV